MLELDTLILIKYDILQKYTFWASTEKTKAIEAFKKHGGE